MSLKMKLVTAGAVLATALCADGASARENLRVVGSNTITEYALAVADVMVEQKFAKPEISPASTGPGLKHFCRGAGDLYPDIAMAGRPIKDEETADCAANGVADITEIRIGYDAVMLAYRNDSSNFSNISLTSRQVWLAIAKQVPVNGVMTANPNRNWNDVDPSLPATAIQFYIPDRASAMRELFSNLVIKDACTDDPAIAAMAEEAQEDVCLTLREDGAVVEFGDSRDELTAMAEADGQPVAITNLQFMSTTPEAKNFKAVTLEGVEPTLESIAAGKYKVKRTHFLYVKNSQVGKVPGVVEFVSNFLSDEAQGPDGYLTKKGLIPLSDEERKEMLSRINSLMN